MLTHGYSGTRARGCSQGYRCHAHLPSPRDLRRYNRGVAGRGDAVKLARGRRQAVLNLATPPAVEERTGLYFNGCVRQSAGPSLRC
jgi:hypothetical protein